MGPGVVNGSLTAGGLIAGSGLPSTGMDAWMDRVTATYWFRFTFAVSGILTMAYFAQVYGH